MEENNEYFLTENLRILNNRMEYKCDNMKFKPILKNDWHINLSEYGWEKLPKKWIKKLNKLSINTTSIVRQKMMDKFLHSIRYEYLFWDSAWHTKGWLD